MAKQLQCEKLDAIATEMTRDIITISHKKGHQTNSPVIYKADYIINKIIENLKQI